MGNPSNGLTLHSDPKGFSIHPNQGDWTWGLEFAGLGSDSCAASPVLASQPIADGSNLSYLRGPGLTEWIKNSEKGVEHGYTIWSPPHARIQRGQPLVIRSHIRGHLVPRISKDDKGVDFFTRQGVVGLSYSGLFVFDAEGKELPAGFGLQGDELHVWVQVEGAVYPITVDPVAQRAYLKASNTDAGDEFGLTVSVSGNTAVIGAKDEGSDATGVNGNQNNNNAEKSGAAYVFVRNGSNWIQQAYLKASNTDSFDNFGHSVAVDGDTIVVGARLEDSGSVGVNGDQSDNSFSRAGAAYVFVRSAGVWTQEAYLKATNTDIGDRFGYSVAVDGDTIVVGAFGEDSIASGVGGNQANNAGTDSGAAYIYHRIGSTWSSQEYLKPVQPAGGAWFGRSVSISGDVAVVGAPNQERSYVFDRVGSAWSQPAVLDPATSISDTGFGQSVDVDGDVVVVGSPGEPQFLSLAAGAAHVFARVSGGWNRQGVLNASNPSTSAWFGHAVSVSGSRIAVGAPNQDSRGPGVNGNPAGTDGVFASGAAYLFELDGGVWSETDFIKSSNPGIGDGFGRAVALSGDLLVVGAQWEDSSATGVNGNQVGNSAADSGAAYVFDLRAPVANICGPANAHSGNVPATISMVGSPVVSQNDLRLVASSLPQGQFGFFLVSMGHGYIAFPGGSQGALCLGGAHPIGRFNRPGEILLSGGAGEFSLDVNLGNVPTNAGSVQITPGQTWYFQGWFRDQNPGSTSNFTDAVGVLFE